MYSSSKTASKCLTAVLLRHVGSAHDADRTHVERGGAAALVLLGAGGTGARARGRRALLPTRELAHAAQSPTCAYPLLMCSLLTLLIHREHSDWLSLSGSDFAALPSCALVVAAASPCFSGGLRVHSHSAYTRTVLVVVLYTVF